MRAVYNVEHIKTTCPGVAVVVLLNLDDPLSTFGSVNPILNTFSFSISREDKIHRRTVCSLCGNRGLS